MFFIFIWTFFTSMLLCCISAVNCVCVESCTSCATTSLRDATDGRTMAVRALIMFSNSASSGGRTNCRTWSTNCRTSLTRSMSTPTGLSWATAISSYDPSTHDITTLCRTGAAWQPARRTRQWKWNCASGCQRAAMLSRRRTAGWPSAAHQAAVANLVPVWKCNICSNVEWCKK